MRPVLPTATLAASALALLLLFCGERAAHACGAAYPGGPVMCDFPRGDHGGSAAAARSRPILRLSSSYAFTSTTLLFSGDRRADLTRHALFGAIEVPLSRSPSSSLALQLGGGGIAAGELVATTPLAPAPRSYEVGPGMSAFAGVAGRVLDGRGAAPFIHLTGTLSVSHAITRASASFAPAAPSERYTAVDLRFGALVGKTFGEGFTPYVVARVFGGPIAWRIEGADVTGTDLYKYQLGGGLSLALLDRRLDLFVEGVGLGERAVAAGVGTTFF